MKKLFTLAAAALIFTGAAFAHEGKKCTKGKSCCSKKEAGKKNDVKDVKTTASLKKA